MQKVETSLINYGANSNEKYSHSPDVSLNIAYLLKIIISVTVTE